MSARDTEIWMWSEACEMLARADRMHRQFFQLQRSRRTPAWEPPVDVLETELEVLVLVALPGVNPDGVEAGIDGGELVILGNRTIPPALHNAVIHRMELPHGQFERRVALPPGRYDQVRRSAVDGCLLITLRKAQ